MEGLSGSDRAGTARLHVAKTGRAIGGLPFSRGHLYKVLSNPIYVGEIALKGRRHEGQHPAIADQTTVKLPGMRKKGLLRDAVRPWLPPEVLDLPKQGFCVPMAEWLRGDLREMVPNVLLDSATLNRGYFREDAVRSLLTRHERNEADNSNMIWSLLVHELWHREFIDHGAGSSQPAGLVAA